MTDEKKSDESAVAPAREEPGTPGDAAPGTGDRDPDRLLDRLMRVTAEFENYRKRVAREREAWTARALESLVLELLPVLDSFDRAMDSMAGAEDPASVLEGMALVRKQLERALELHDVKPIEALGREFDPSLHEAFLSRPAGEGEVPGTIVEEFLKGYRLGDRTIRATKGIVAVSPEAEAGSRPGSEEE